VARFSADNKWYRAKIVDVKTDVGGLVTVEYVDYGNTESLPLADVSKLIRRFIQLPAQVTR